MRLREVLQTHVKRGVSFLDTHTTQPCHPTTVQVPAVGDLVSPTVRVGFLFCDV